MADTIGTIAKKDIALAGATTTWATSHLIDKRNELIESSPGLAGVVKVFGELCFVGLAIASAVEALIRIILGVIIGVPLKCLVKNEWVYALTLGGGIMSATNAAICVVALLKNFTQGAELNHDGILACANPFLEVVAEALFT